MKKYMKNIKKAPLFTGLMDSEIEAITGCLGARIVEYKKGDYILRVGDSVDSIGLLLEGSALTIQEDFWGNRNIVSQISCGQLFASSFACSPGSVLNVSVIADANCAIMFLNVQRVMTTCSATCVFHSRMIRNLLSDLAEKNISFNEKLTHMSRRTTREKLLSYLSATALESNSSEFDIPFNRQQLADYLSVDRSAMSSELCRLRDDGILTFEKNHFCLMVQAYEE